MAGIEKKTVTLSAFIIGGLIVAAILAFGVSGQASSKPDGLSKVAIDKGLDRAEKPHSMENLPTAGYSIKGVDNSRLSTGLAGLIGVAVTFAIGYGVVLLMRKTARRESSGVSPSGG